MNSSCENKQQIESEKFLFDYIKMAFDVKSTSSESSTSSDNKNEQR